jgi:hypothetical protein
VNKKDLKIGEYFDELSDQWILEKIYILWCLLLQSLNVLKGNVRPRTSHEGPNGE